MSLSFRTNGNFIDFVNTDATSLNVETVIMKLHNTSRCIDWSLPEDTTKISFTIDEVKYSNIPITEIDFDGTVMNSQDDFETGITGMFEGLAGGGSGGVESVTGDMVNNDDALNPVISINDAPFADSIGGNEFIGIIQDDEFKNTTIQSIIDLVQPPVPNIEQVLTAGDNANGLNIAKVGTLGIGNLESLPTNSLFNISDGLGTGSNMINASFNSGTSKSIVTVGATGAEGQDYAYLQLRNDSGSEFYLYADDGYFRGAAGESPTIAWWDVTEFKFNVPLRLTSVQEFADNAAAVTGGLTAGMVYRTGDVLKIVHA